MHLLPTEQNSDVLGWRTDCFLSGLGQAVSVRDSARLHCVRRMMISTTGGVPDVP